MLPEHGLTFAHSALDFGEQFALIAAGDLGVRDGLAVTDANPAEAGIFLRARPSALMELALNKNLGRREGHMFRNPECPVVVPRRECPLRSPAST